MCLHLSSHHATAAAEAAAGDGEEDNDENTTLLDEEVSGDGLLSFLPLPHPPHATPSSQVISATTCRSSLTSAKAKLGCEVSAVSGSVWGLLLVLVDFTHTVSGLRHLPYPAA